MKRWVEGPMGRRLLPLVLALGLLGVGCGGAGAVGAPLPPIDNGAATKVREQELAVAEAVRAYLVAWLGENKRICNGVVVDAGEEGQGVAIVGAAHCGKPAAVGVPALDGPGGMERQGNLWWADDEFGFASDPDWETVKSLGDETDPGAYGADAAAVWIKGEQWEVENHGVSGGLGLGLGVGVGEQVFAVGLASEQLRRFTDRQVSVAEPVAVEGVVVEGGDSCPELAMVVQGRLGVLEKGRSGEPVVRMAGEKTVEVVGVLTAATGNGGWACFSPAEELEKQLDRVVP